MQNQPCIDYSKIDPLIFQQFLNYREKLINTDLTSVIQNDNNLCMRGKIRTKQKCPKCKGLFKDTSKDLVCPTCLTTPNRYYIDVFWHQQIKVYSDTNGRVLDSYELAGELIKNKSPAKAKPGQIAPEDLEIPAGPTDLTPGPAISELGALGIQIQIQGGKIEIKEPKVVAKKGEAIKTNAAEMLGKLGIQPFKIGFTPLSAYDSQDDLIYTEIVIDTEGTRDALIYAYSRALPFAVEIGYMSPDTTPLMIQKAAAYERKLIRVITGEPEEVVEETPAQEETPKEEVKEEPKVDAAAGLGTLFG